MAMGIDETFGAFLVGTLFGVMLYGMIILQIYQYFRRYPDDDSTYKALVGVLAMLETFHILVCVHVCYFYLVTSFQDPQALASGVWSINILTALSGLIVILSQSFFARRVYLIGKSFRALVLVAVALLVGELGFFVAASVEAFIRPEFAHFQKFTWLISAGAAMAVVADGLLTSVLVTVLKRNVTGMKRMDTIVDILILYAISTGLLTRHGLLVTRAQQQASDDLLANSVVNFLSFLFSLVSPSKLIYTAFGIVATELYANSLLAALNSRKYLAERASGNILSSSLINVRATRALPASLSFTIVSPTNFRLAPPSSCPQTPITSPTFPPTPRTGGMPSPSAPRF